MTVRSRKQGKSIILTIPKAFKVKENVEFEPSQLPDGTLQFVPVTKAFPEIWKDDPRNIAAFNREIGKQDDGADYDREGDAI